jgi:uncharacterized C2H2 Zn-finger protein
MARKKSNIGKRHKNYEKKIQEMHKYVRGRPKKGVHQKQSSVSFYFECIVLYSFG